MIDGHGDDAYRYSGKVIHNFSSNIYSDVDHSNLMSHLSTLGDKLKSYPEPEARSLEKALASAAGVNDDEIMVTNGATEAIYLIAMSLRNSICQIAIPAFREYQDACRIHGVNVEFVADLSRLSENVNAFWLCNPANPTGIVTDETELMDCIGRHPDTLFVIDQAYAAYSMKPVVDIRQAIEAGNVIILSSLTKDFAVPGLRIGYAAGAAPVLDRLRSLRMPWTVNALAIEAAHFLLDHRDCYAIDRNMLHSEVSRMACRLADVGITSSSSDCNFILCRLPGNHSASALKEYLVEKHGILIRDASNFEGLDHHYFRVAAQAAHANDMLVDAIIQFLQK